MRKSCVIALSLLLVLPAVFFVSGCKNEADEDQKPTVVPVLPPVYYSQFGATGNGKTDDFDAIIAAHEEANRTGAEVRADADAIYYIGNAQKSAVIKTDTNWGNAQFIIDDTEIEFTNRWNPDRGGHNEKVWQDSWVFHIAPSLDPYEIDSIATLEKNQSKLSMSFPQDMLLVPIDSNTLRYRRKGENANAGAPQQDAIVVDKNGNIDQKAPVMWDFEQITSLTAYPIDEKRLTVRGGRFRTINNTGNADDLYMKRGIHVNRSNTVIDGIYHDIIEEGAQGASYTGFLYFENCANVTLQNSTLSGHFAYYRPSQTYTRRGSYDIQVNRTVNMSVIDCDQTNEITDRLLYGIFASNYSKNILFDGVKFSRFDAHMGVYNTTLLNSELGYMGVSIIGSGLLLIEDTKVSGENFIYFREDYGSTWEGEVVIRNCVFAPSANVMNTASIIFTANDGTHDFYYECFMPETIEIDGFIVEDSPAPAGYNGVYLVSARNTNTATERYPFTLTKTIYLSGYESSRDYRMSNNYIRSSIEVVIP